MNPPPSELLALLEYRLQSVAIGHLALQYSMAWDVAPPIKIFFGERQVIEGRATAFTNGAIEAAIVHCRALLEFLGLKGNGISKLSERTSAQKDDFVIESAGLSKVSVDAAVRTYAGASSEAESALAHVIYLANKGLAHTTTSFQSTDGDAALIEVAFRGVPKLVLEFFYKPLGLTAPNYELSCRPAA